MLWYKFYWNHKSKWFLKEFNIWDYVVIKDKYKKDSYYDFYKWKSEKITHISWYWWYTVENLWHRIHPKKIKKWRQFKFIT